MRILHLIPTIKGGGAEYQLINTFTNKSVINGSYNIHIAVRTADKNLVKKLKEHDITVHTLGNHRAILNPILLFKILLLIINIRPSLIQTWLPQMDIIGGLASIILNKPFVISERTSASAYENSPLTSMLRKTISNKSLCVIANSKAGCDYWKNSTFKGHVFKINNGVDLFGINNSSFTELKEHNIDEGVFNFIIAGRLSKENQVKKILQACSRVNNISNTRLLIVGDGPEKKSIIDLIKKLDLKRNVFLLGWIDNWWGLLQKSQCFITCSDYEGQPNALIEAIASKCPTIVSDNISHREILNDKSSNFFDSTDVCNLTQQMNYVIANYDLCLSKSNIAYNKIKKNSFNNTFLKYLKVYKFLLKDK